MKNTNKILSLNSPKTTSKPKTKTKKIHHTTSFQKSSRLYNRKNDGNYMDWRK